MQRFAWFLIGLCHTDATGVLSEALATVEDNDQLDDFSPHVIHQPHKPFPIAMVNRKPHGSEFDAIQMPAMPSDPYTLS
jgi:hypothetical protein